jgi:hypothetical protein
MYMKEMYNLSGKERCPSCGSFNTDFFPCEGFETIWGVYCYRCGEITEVEVK